MGLGYMPISIAVIVEINGVVTRFLRIADCRVRAIERSGALPASRQAERELFRCVADRCRFVTRVEHRQSSARRDLWNWGSDVT